MYATVFYQTDNSKVEKVLYTDQNASLVLGRLFFRLTIYVVIFRNGDKGCNWTKEAVDSKPVILLH